MACDLRKERVFGTITAWRKVAELLLKFMKTILRRKGGLLPVVGKIVGKSGGEVAQTPPARRCRIAAARSKASSRLMPASWYMAKMFSSGVSGGIVCEAARM